MSDPLEAYLASKAPAGADPLEAYLSERQPAAAPAPEKPEPSIWESLARGAVQGATFGFADELAGLGAGLLGERKVDDRTGKVESFDERYHRVRDESRGNFHAAEEAHPIASAVGNIGGSLATSVIPGGAIVKGGGFVANAFRGAGAGILSGIGSSEADTVEGVGMDAGKSGLVGALLGGVIGTGMERLVRGAPGRVDARTIQNITGGRATKAAGKITDARELVLDTAKKFGLATETDVGKLAETAQAHLKDVGAQLGAARQTLGDEALGVRMKDALRAVADVKKRFDAPSEAPLRQRVDAFMEQMRTSWGAGRDRVSIEKLNAQITKLENIGYTGAELTPTAGKQLSRDLAHALEDVQQARLDEIRDLGAKVANSSLAKRAAFAGLTEAKAAADALPGLNADYRGLKLIANMARERARQPPSNQAAGGLRNIAGNAVNTGALVASVATGNPLPFLAAKVGIPAAAAGARGADRALAALQAAASRGSVPAQLVQQAIEAGVPRGVVEALAPGIASAVSGP